MARYGPSFRHLRLPTIDWAGLVGKKYKPNDKDEEIIGATSTLLMWRTFLAVDNSDDDAGDTGLDLDAFDVTTRADSARIRLINESGSSKYINGCVIRGKPILRYSGDHGRVHDSLIDYEDIIKNGEKEFEFGNNYICLRSQLDQLTDWYWKNLTTKRHIYGVEIPGRCYWYSPGEWYTLDIEDVKGAENIDSIVVECLHVQVENQTNPLGRSLIVFREVYQSWVHDINAVSYFLSGGDPVAALHFDRIKIASSTYLDVADVYCDGVSDETEINATIANLAGAGGGLVELTEGTFVTDEKIVPANSIGIIGHGWNTIIEKNGNYHGIELIGSGGSEYSNVVLANFKITKNAADENAQQDLIELSFVDNLIMQNVWCYDSYDMGALLTSCDNAFISGCHFTDCGDSGLYFAAVGGTPNKARVIGNYVYNNSGDGLVLGVVDHSTIDGNICIANTGSGLVLSGSDHNSITSNICEGNGGAANTAGMLLSNSDDNVLTGNICEGNEDGLHIASGDKNVLNGNRATGNATDNFVDGGTNTTDSGNDWT